MKERLTSAFLAVLSIACLQVSGTASFAQSGCAEPDTISADKAPKAQVSVKASARPLAGEPMELSWEVSNAESVPEHSPVYLVLAFPDAVRFEIRPQDTRLSVSDDEHLASRTIESGTRNGPGLIALPSGSRSPWNIRFGEGGTRAFIPLHLSQAPLKHGILVKPYLAGSFKVEWAVVAKPNCSEKEIQLGDVGNFATAIYPGPPKIVIVEPAGQDAPDRIVQSNSGRYELRVFGATYKVLDLTTGEKVLERAGWFPNFSPGSRFIAAQVGSDRRGTPPVEVIDLATGELVESALRASELGWVDGDAFLIRGNHPYGNLGVHQSLIDWRAEDDPTKSRSFLIHTFGGNASNNSWFMHSFNIDLDAGVLLANWTGNDGKEEEPRWIVALASGRQLTGSTTQSSLADEINQARQKWQQITDRPVVALKGWQNLTDIRLSHFDPQQDTNGRRRAELGLRPPSAFFAQHHEVSSDQEPTPRTTAADLKTIRGDWREIGVPKAIGRAENALRDRFPSSMAGFGLTLLGGRAPVSLIRRTSFDIRSPREVVFHSEFTVPVERIEARLKREFPEFGKLTYRRSDDDAQWCFVDKFQKKGLDFRRDVIGLWNWRTGDAEYWLVDNLCIYKGFVGYQRLFLLSSSSAGNRVAELRSVGAITSQERSDEEGAFRSDQHALQLHPTVVADRYLVLNSVYGSVAHVIDMESSELAGAATKISDADAVIETFLEDGAQVRIVQLLRNGQFFIYPLTAIPAWGTKPASSAWEADEPSDDDSVDLPELSEFVLSGRFADDELILYDTNACYWSSYEGAHFVHLKFAGQPGLNSFAQFRAQRERPDVIRAILQGKTADCSEAAVEAPPTVTLRVEKATADELVVEVRALSLSGLHKLRIFQDGQLTAEKEVSGAQVETALQMSRMSGSRWVTAAAVDANGLVSQPAAVVLPEGSQKGPRHLGLAVGISKYQNSKLDLRYAASDATLFERSVKGSAGKYYSTVEIDLLRDEQVVASEIKRRLEEMVARAEPGDTVSFFFSGHGVRDAAGQLYLTTHVTAIDNLAGTALRWDDIASILGRSQARVLVFIDACHAGAADRDFPVSNDQAVHALLGSIRAPVIVFASSKGRQFSEEGPEIKAGYFTATLADIVGPKRQRYDKNGNGVLEISELYAGLKSNVLSLTEGRQTPWLVRSDIIGDFALF